jgi:hypothetical protein
MRDQVDSDITLFLYTSIEFIERALAETKGQGKILVHCFKVSKQIVYNINIFSIGKLSFCSHNYWIFHVETGTFLSPSDRFGPHAKRLHRP